MRRYNNDKRGGIYDWVNNRSDWMYGDAVHDRDNMIRVLELFAGIGACSKALTRLGIDHTIVDAVEIDKYAIQAFNAVHGTNFEPQDIRTWDKDIECDLIMHGSPCQDFSIAGRQAGGDEGSGTRSSLMYETLRIVEKLKPKYVIWENVKNLLSKKHRHNFDAYLEAMGKLGYKNYYQVINAKHYGVPQNRERVFTVSIRLDIPYCWAFEFPKPIPLEKKLKDVLEKEVDEKYYLSPEVSSTLSTMQGGNRRPKIVEEDNYVAIKTANKQGFDLAADGDGVDLAYPESKTRRGRVGHGVSKTITTGDSMGVVEFRTKDKRIIETAEKSNFRNGETAYLDVYNRKPRADITSTINAATNSHQNNIIATNYRIRKLTPKECWRLMGFDDEDFDKAKSTGLSNTQLYKQAGNSIVVNVLEAILTNLLEGK